MPLKNFNKHLKHIIQGCLEESERPCHLYKEHSLAFQKPGHNKAFK